MFYDSDLVIDTVSPQTSPHSDLLFSADNATNTSTVLPETTAPGDAETNANTVRQKEPSSEDSCPLLARKRRQCEKKKEQPSQAELEAKRRNFLDRNRTAARKCRQKKKDEIDSLGEKRLQLESKNAALRMQLDALRCELKFCKDAVMAHASCNYLDVSARIKYEVACLSGRGEERCPSLAGGTSSVGCNGSRRAI